MNLITICRCTISMFPSWEGFMQNSHTDSINNCYIQVRSEEQATRTQILTLKGTGKGIHYDADARMPLMQGHLLYHWSIQKLYMAMDLINTCTFTVISTSMTWLLLTAIWLCSVPLSIENPHTITAFVLSHAIKVYNSRLHSQAPIFRTGSGNEANINQQS